MENEIIASQIESIHKTDQELRLIGKFDLEIDAQNSEKIKAIYQEIGFPTINKVGKSASHHFVTILLHSTDIEFKKKVLDNMKSLLDEDAHKKDIAYLEDKILITEGKKQMYGTQLTFNEMENTYIAIEIDNFENVNQSRKEIGLDSLEEYIQFANEERRKMNNK
jgi:hypothetical protein